MYRRGAHLRSSVNRSAWNSLQNVGATIATLDTTASEPTNADRGQQDARQTTTSFPKLCFVELPFHRSATDSTTNHSAATVIGHSRQPEYHCDDAVNAIRLPNHFSPFLLPIESVPRRQGQHTQLSDVQT